MNIIKARPQDMAVVSGITQTTIRSIYPRYYPQGAVELFANYHSAEKISSDIKNGYVYLLEDNGIITGTVTVEENHIGRLFVLPRHQHKGYGRALLDFAEDLIFSRYDNIRLDASLPAKKIYLLRGYREIEYNIEPADNDFLCYDVMVKEK